MKVRLALALPLAASVAGCDRLDVADEPVAYDPGDAGTVDHALCLLGFTGIPLRELRSGHHLVDTTVNGRPAAFVLDTGANATVVHSPYAEELGIGDEATLPAGMMGTGGPMAARQVRIESMAIGGVPIRQNRIVAADLSQLADSLGGLSGERIYGLVGQDILGEHRAVIDVAGQLLFLIEADTDPAPVPADRCTGEEGDAAAEEAPPEAER